MLCGGFLCLAKLLPPRTLQIIDFVVFLPVSGITDALNMTGMFGQGTIAKEPEIT